MYIGIIVPAFALSAYWVWKRRVGIRVHRCPAVKIAALDGAVLAMALFMILDGQPVLLPQIVIFGTLTLISMLFMARFLASFSQDQSVYQRLQPTLKDKKCLSV